MDIQGRKLGKNPVRYDTRTLRLAKYAISLPTPPPSIDFASKVGDWPMMANDSVGDCTCAAAGHMVQQWSTYANTPTVMSDGEILGAYSAITGYSPSDPNSDQGANMLDVLNYWRKTGIGAKVDKIAAFTALDMGKLLEMQLAVSLFGNCYIGVNMPISAQSQEDLWDVVPDDGSGNSQAGSWGGHCIPIVGYEPGKLAIVTWGKLIKMTEAFYLTYCEEAYAVLSQDWIASSGNSPSGFDLVQLQLDLGNIT